MTVIDIPAEPDLARMNRERGARLRAAMAAQGVDALILLGNNAVTYATGASWPLGDSGLAHVDRPVAVVVADDPWPHLFMPFREGTSHSRRCLPTTSTLRSTWSSTKGYGTSRPWSPPSCPAGRWSRSTR